LPSFIAVEWSK